MGAPPGGMGGGMGAPPPGAPMATPPASGGGSSVGKWIGIGCGVLFLLSCLAWGGCYACSMMAASTIPPVPVTAPGVGGPVPTVGGGGGGSTCARAVECCNAYAATPLGASVASSCPSYNTAGMPDSACQSAIDGFRTGFTATGQAVPAACQ